MRALWGKGDLEPRRHLRLVTSGTAAQPQSGRSLERAGRAAAPDAPVIPDDTLPRRGVHLSVEDLGDLEQLAVIAARMRDATTSLEQALRDRDFFDALIAARGILHIGLLAGDRSRAMERRL